MTREKLKNLLNEYGSVALWTYLVIWLLTLAGFAVAISMGVQVESASGGIGLAGMTWVATKLTQPLRIAGTLALTPLVASVLRKFRGKPAEPPAAEPPAAGPPEPPRDPSGA